MITYKLLSNGRAVILNRSAVVAKGKVEFEFQNAPLGANAVFSSLNSKEKYYRPLENGACNVPAEYFEGTVDITLAIFNQSPIKRWRCESLKCTKMSGGEVLIVADDANLPEEFVKLRVEVDELREKNGSLERKIEALHKSFQEIMQGYNII